MSVGAIASILWSFSKPSPRRDLNRIEESLRKLKTQMHISHPPRNSTITLGRFKTRENRNDKTLLSFFSFKVTDKVLHSDDKQRKKQKSFQCTFQSTEKFEWKIFCCKVKFTFHWSEKIILHKMHFCKSTRCNSDTNWQNKRERAKFQQSLCVGAVDFEFYFIFFFEPDRAREK